MGFRNLQEKLEKVILSIGLILNMKTKSYFLLEYASNFAVIGFCHILVKIGLESRIALKNLYRPDDSGKTINIKAKLDIFKPITFSWLLRIIYLYLVGLHLRFRVKSMPEDMQL